MIYLKPSVALKYVSENRAKKIVFTNVLSSVMNSITASDVPFFHTKTKKESLERNLRNQNCIKKSLSL
jgi:hypothetical protein